MRDQVSCEGAENGLLLDLLDELVREAVDVNPAHRLVASLRSHLESNGSIHLQHEQLLDLGVDPEQWRGAARRAARQLGRPVQTGSGSSSVWAVLKDWPATEIERVRHQAQLRHAVEAASVIVVDPLETE